MLFQKIIDANKNMAASLLSEFEEFYPFAHGEDSKNEIHTIGTYTGTDTPDINELVDALKVALNVAVKKYDLIATSICLSISFIPRDKEEKVDGIRILIDSKEYEPITIMIPYLTKNREIAFGKEEIYKGSTYISF